MKKPFSGVMRWTADRPTSAAIGRLLLDPMLVPFEAVSLVLLAALIGAVLFAQKNSESI